MTEKELKFEDIEDCGPTTARALKAAGLFSVADLASASVLDVMQETDYDREKCLNLINNARKLLNENNLLETDYITGTEDLAKEATRVKYSTGSKALDQLLQGGIEAGTFTEIFGKNGSSKTQIAKTVSVLCQVDPERSGVVYIDTEGAFRSQRIKQIAEARELNVDEILRNIHVVRPSNAGNLEYHLRYLAEAVEKFKACLVVVDSISNLHRVEYLGRGQLAERQQKLNGLMAKLKRLAVVYNVAIIGTNQIQDRPDTFFGDPTVPVGGNVVGHASGIRLHVKQAGKDRTATMLKASWIAYETIRYTINEKGVDDVEEAAKKKKGDVEE